MGDVLSVEWCERVLILGEECCRDCIINVK